MSVKKIVVSFCAFIGADVPIEHFAGDMCSRGRWAAIMLPRLSNYVVFAYES